MHYANFYSSPLTNAMRYGILKKDLGVAQVVARYLGVVEAVGSSPVTQTITTLIFLMHLAWGRFFLLFTLIGRSPHSVVFL